MLTKIAMSLTNRLKRSGIVSAEAEDIYIYGFELVISFLFSTITILLIGIIFKLYFETLCFLLIFIALRSFTGGYHANKYWRCNIITLGSYLSVMLLSKCVVPDIVFYIIIFIVGLLLIIFKAPIENVNKPLSKTQKSRFNFVSIIMFVAFSLMSLALYKGIPSLSAVFFYTLLVDLIMMVISIKNILITKNERS